MPPQTSQSPPTLARRTLPDRSTPTPSAELPLLAPPYPPARKASRAQSPQPPLPLSSESCWALLQTHVFRHARPEPGSLPIWEASAPHGYTPHQKTSSTILPPRRSPAHTPATASLVPAPSLRTLPETPQPLPH